MSRETGPVTFVIFGASGDLTKRKLIPALYEQHRKGRLPENTRIVGVARRPLSDSDFRQEMRAGTGTPQTDANAMALWSSLAARLFYQRADLDMTDSYSALAERLRTLDGDSALRVYYLAIAPELYVSVIRGLGHTGLVQRGNKNQIAIIEKPFGSDLASARVLNGEVHKVLAEDQVYRIDHYLGKETAQNIMFLRFANTIFEPIWNRQYIANVQITVAETVDVGHRTGYYDVAGVLRDMFQNHLLQLLTLVAMEPPSSFTADALRNEKVKVLNAIRELDIANTVRGQYEGYRLDGLRSDTETYGAVGLFIDNWRWQGVPFYMRSGKALQRRTSEVAIQFTAPPHLMFHLPPGYEMKSNTLSICIQPDEGIHLNIETKVPDSNIETRSVDLEFHYRSSFGDAPIPDAYERLLSDAIRGDAALFARSDEIEAAWRIIDPLLTGWRSPERPPLHVYRRGSWGPEEAMALPRKHGNEWRLGCSHD